MAMIAANADRVKRQRPPRSFGRRAFLQSAAALAAVGHAPIATSDDHAAPEDVRTPFPGVVVRQTNPDNLEFPFSSLDGFYTPNEQFYVRTHFEVPQLDAATWKLDVGGAVRRPFSMTYDELCKLPSKTIAALLECSGNGRVNLEPPQSSIRWDQGGVSNGEWTGVPLSTVLERAGVKEEAVEVILEGADRGEFREPNPKTPGRIPYACSLPLDKARGEEVLLAYRMNGRELPALHGFPVRAVVAGWYGMASVKWLRRILIVDQPFHGFFQTFMYAIWDRREGLPTLVPVREIQVKSQIARPARGEVLHIGEKYRVFGAAWAGEPQIAKVEVSTDGGGSWNTAELSDRSVPFAWRFWHYNWKPARPGRHVIQTRATDDRGRTQPLKRDEDRRDAVISHVQPIEVEVREPLRREANE